MTQSVTQSVSILLSVLFCFPLTGCIAFYRYHPREIQVRDAEADSPVANAQVTVGYPGMLIWNLPKSTSATTDAHGKAILRVATYEPKDWLVEADGFLHTSPFFGPDALGILRIYRKPDPRITIILPNGYRGPVEIEMVQVKSWIQAQVGQREFQFKASRTGYVRIEATPLLRQYAWLDIAARFENGTPLPPQDFRIGPSDVALRHLYILGNQFLDVVGTDREFQAVRASVFNYKHGDPNDTSLNEHAFDALFRDASATQVPDQGK